MQRVYSRFSTLPGMTRASLYLRQRALKDLYEGDRYVYAFRGVPLIAEDPLHLRVAIRPSVLSGYIQRRDIRASDVVLDAGAFPGNFSIYAAKKAEKVVALEPDPRNARKLRRRLNLNDVSNVDVVEKGLWSERTTLSFSANGNGTSAVGDEGDFDIETTTLDDVLAAEGRIDFVKADIGGAEIEALQGAEKMLERAETSFAIATYHMRDGKQTSEEVEDVFRQYNYSVETGNPLHLTTWANPQGDAE